MLRCGARLIGFLLPCVAFAQGVPTKTPTGRPFAQPVSVNLQFDTYAAGIPVAHVEAGLRLDPTSYHITLAYSTTGMVAVIVRGHESDHVAGTWRNVQAVPSRFDASGSWRGVDRQARIDYDHGVPVVRVLIPPDETEREPVPEAMQTNTIDTLSAMSQLIHVVAETGRCETSVHTYDGRRALQIEARTAGEEMLQPTGRSTFTGKALRCDFVGRMLAGFKFGSDGERDRKSMRGSAWLAPLSTGGPPLPVRMSFETRWFGDATMYLTDVGSGAESKVARGQ
jgi:hypothetical protein